ncbi:iron ABC transporter permease, partial [Butyricicoccus sp. 1XD8-22]
MPKPKGNRIFITIITVFIVIFIGFYLHVTNGMFDMSISEV